MYQEKWENYARMKDLNTNENHATLLLVAALHLLQFHVIRLHLTRKLFN